MCSELKRRRKVLFHQIKKVTCSRFTLHVLIQCWLSTIYCAKQVYPEFLEIWNLFLSISIFKIDVMMDADNIKHPASSSKLDGDDNKCDINQESKALFKFRNYTSQTHFLDGLYTIDKAQPGSIAEYIEDKIKLASDSDYLIDDGENKYKINPEKLNLQKIDADLKRRIEDKLEKLENETRRQISKHLKSQKSRNR